MASYASERAGLGLRYGPGERLGADDLNQLADSLAATRRVLGGVVGGAGVYAGGAAVLADLAGGTQYPAVTLQVADNSGSLWPFETALPTAITFAATSTTAGAARLYAVPQLLAGSVPPAAAGGPDDVTFVADDVANAAPANALLLGSGTIVASAFTAYTPAAGAVPATSTVAPAAHGHAPGDVTGTAVITSDARLSDARPPTAHAASHAPGGADAITALALAAGGLRLARWAHIGPPVLSGAAGDLGLDALGALWQRGATGWEQLTAGTATVWSGGGATDITLAANWYDDTMLGGYRAYEPSYGAEWQRDGALGRWLGRRQMLTLVSSFVSVTSTSFAIHMPVPYDVDLVVVRAALIFMNSTVADASNFWTLSIESSTGTVLASAVNQVPLTYTYLNVEVPRILVVTGQVAASRNLNVKATKTGAPSGGSIFGSHVCYLEARK